MRGGIKVIPCLEIMDGRVAKGVRNAGLTDVSSPVEAARYFCEQGADEIWLLDRHTSTVNHTTRLDIVRRVAAVSSIPVGVLGGVRTLSDAERLVEAGASRIGMATAALHDHELIQRVSYRIGKERTVAALHLARNRMGKMTLHNPQMMEVDADLRTLVASLAHKGVGELLLKVSGAEDGEPFDEETLSIMQEAANIPFIVGGHEFSDKAFATIGRTQGISGLMGTTLFQFGNMSIGEAKEKLAAHGATVRTEQQDLSFLKFGKEDGLIPAIAQDVHSGQVLMQAYMSEATLRETLNTRYATYYSRSRQERWRKGETSGHLQKVREILADCDGDSLLLRVEQIGPACHTGERTCFHNPLQVQEDGLSGRKGSAVLRELYNLVAERIEKPKEGSYTNSLLDGGVNRIGKKVVEEAAEVVLAAKDNNFRDVRFEAADLVYHLIVLLAQQGVALDDLYAELDNRR